MILFRSPPRARRPVAALVLALALLVPGPGPSPADACGRPRCGPVRRPRRPLLVGRGVPCVPRRQPVRNLIRGVLGLVAMSSVSVHVGSSLPRGVWAMPPPMWTPLPGWRPVAPPPMAYPPMAYPPMPPGFGGPGTSVRVQVGGPDFFDLRRGW